jgi:hypothetical protein
MTPTPQQLVQHAITLLRDRELAYPGICLACGEAQDGCEPDACQYECENCGAAQVYGAEEVILMGGRA